MTDEPKKVVLMDFAEIELRILAGTFTTDDPGPAERAARDRWKAETFGKHYGVTGRLKDLFRRPR